MAKVKKEETKSTKELLRLTCTVIVSQLIVEGMTAEEIYSALYDSLAKREKDIRKKHEGEDVVFKFRVLVVDKGYNTVKEYIFINNKLIDNDNN